MEVDFGGGWTIEQVRIRDGSDGKSNPPSAIGAAASLGLCLVFPAVPKFDFSQ